MSKTLFAMLAMAMLASSAQATIQVDAFIVFAGEPSADNLKLLVFEQFWGFFSPLIAGPLYVMLYYMWNHGTATQTVDSTTVTITYAQALGFIGVGNLDGLVDLMLGLFLKIGKRYAACYNILPSTAVTAYNDTENELITKMELTTVTNPTC